MPTLNKQIFFDTIRDSLFDGILRKPQVEGIDVDLNYWFSKYANFPLEWLAYILATEYHETGKAMQPIKEKGGSVYYKKMYDKHGSRPDVAAELGNTEAGDGELFAGRGKVMITGRRNYRVASNLVKANLEQNPELALDLNIAVKLLFDGMFKGIYTGAKLSDFGSGINFNAIDARRIVNGKDEAPKIRQYYLLFLDALLQAVEQNKPVELEPVAVAPKPYIPPVTESIPQIHYDEPVVKNTPSYIDYNQYDEPANLNNEMVEFRRWKIQQEKENNYKKPSQSKIITVAVSSLASYLTVKYGVDLSPEIKSLLMDAIYGLGSAAIIYFRIFKTTKQVSLK